MLDTKKSKPPISATKRPEYISEVALAPQYRGVELYAPYHQAFFLQQALTKLPSLASNSLYSPGEPRTDSPPASAS